MHHHGVIFNFGSVKVCSPTIIETCFSCDKDIWIAGTDHYMFFYIIVLFPLSAILHDSVNKFYSFINFSLLINAVIFAVELSCFNTLSLHTFSFS